MPAAPQDAVLVEVLPNHRFDEAALAAFLRGRLPGIEHGLVVRQIQGGQSNPTYHLEAGDHAYVLRKQPSGPLLPGAHAIDREFTSSPRSLARASRWRGCTCSAWKTA